MKGNDVFVPHGVGHSADSIAKVLFGFYKSRCKDDALVELKSTKQLLGMLTPEVCQLYVDSVHNDVDHSASEEEQVLAEEEINIDMLEHLGVLK